MKYIKYYKLFESNKYDSFIRDVEDLSLELSDLGMEVKVWSEIDTQTNTPVPNSYKEAIQVNIKKFPDGLLDIKEFIERASDILEDFHVKCFALSNLKVYQFDYKDIKDENTVITNLGEYRDVDFYEIFVRFYKPENVYHVIRYNIKPHRGGWSLVDVNIKTKEEANRIYKDYIEKIKNVDILQDHSLLVITDGEYWNAVGDEKYFRKKIEIDYNDNIDYIEEVINMIKSNESNQNDSLNPKLSLDDILDVQDCFREIEDNSKLVVKKSFYDIESEEWLPIVDFNKVEYSINFYITTSGEFRYDIMEENELQDIFSAIKRSYDILKSNTQLGKDFNFNIQYREMKRSYHSPSIDRKIEFENIESLLNKEIYSVSFTLHTDD